MNTAWYLKAHPVTLMSRLSHTPNMTRTHKGLEFDQKVKTGLLLMLVTAWLILVIKASYNVVSTFVQRYLIHVEEGSRLSLN